MNLTSETIIYSELTDEEIVEIYCNSTASLEVQDNIEEVEEIAIELSKYEKLIQIANILCWLDNGDTTSKIAINSLCNIQYTLKESIKADKRKLQIQSNLDNYWSIM